MKLITVCDDYNRAKMLEESANKFGWEYTPIRTSWRGFGTKLVKLYEYLTTTDIHDFVFADAYDVVVKGTPEQLMEIVNGKPALISSEVNCWPDVAMLERYEAYEKINPNIDKYRFVNSGTYYMTVELFCNMYQLDPPQETDDDQRWLTKKVLDNNLAIDTKRLAFQTLCGLTDNDYSFIDGTFLTNYGNMPIFIHGNGKANMEWIR
jgi:hypothetical protein